MKFTKEQAVQNLTSIFAPKVKDIDLSRTIAEAVDNGMAMIGEASEMELNDFTATIEKIVMSAVGLTRHESSVVANRLNGEIEELKKKATPPAPATPPTPPANDELTKALNRIAALEEAANKRTKQETESQKRQAISDYLTNNGVTDKKWIEKMVGRIAISEDTDVEKEGKDCLELFNGARAKSSSFTPKTPGGVSPESQEQSVIALAKKKMQLQEQMANGGKGDSAK